MTVPHDTRALAPASVPAAITTLRVRGLRISSARRLVLEALFAADGPVTADAIAAGLDGRFPCSDLASVYRNLDTLEEIGLVRHFHVAHGAGQYAIAGHHQAGYAACERCGAHRPLAAATVEQIAAVLREACGYEPQLVHFPVIAHCPECRHAHP
jgi:Fur family ferric uptake transcriptional regulator